MSNTTSLSTKAKINNIIYNDKKSTKTETINIDKKYEIAIIPEYYTINKVRKISKHKTIFRLKTNKKCYIDFDLEPGSGDNDFMLYINFFACNVKGDGLKLLVALVRYISEEARKNELNVNTSVIQLLAEPLEARGGLNKLVEYYQRIGFNLADEYIEIEENVPMIANIIDFINLHRDVSVGGTKKAIINKKRKTQKHN